MPKAKSCLPSLFDFNGGSVVAGLSATLEGDRALYLTGNYHRWSFISQLTNKKSIPAVIAVPAFRKLNIKV
jgi:hypothetical protein